MGLSVEIQKKFPGFVLETQFEVGNETLGLLGGSGSGKSMTLKCIAGVVRPDRGRIVLNGRVLFDSVAGIDLSPQQRRIGYLFQHYALFPTMTVAQNIRCGMQKEKGSLDEVLERFYLTGLENRFPAQLSGGQQQRTALARMLVSSPDILMLDEPFSALDSHLREEMERTVLGILKDFEGPALLVSHSRDEICHLCEQIAVYHSGRINRSGSVKSVFEAPGTETAARLTGCRNILDAQAIDNHIFEIKGWGTVLQTQTHIERQFNMVGIRAHYFQMVEQPGDNVIAGSVKAVVDGPFEQIVYVQPDKGKELLCWKTEKRVLSEPGWKILLHVPPEAVMPLVKDSL